MQALTDEQKMEIENKSTYIDEKALLLKEYKSYAENLLYADDEFEEDLILQKREKLAFKIKALADQIRHIESLEMQV